MLGWAVTFLVIALVAGLLGFTGIAGAAAGIAKILFFVFLSTLMIPWEATIIPNYMFVRSIGWTDTYQGLSVPFMATAFGTFLLRQAFLQIPRELWDSARIDGASSFRFFRSMVLPLSRPILGTVAIYAFLSTYNQYFWPLLITNTDGQWEQAGLRMTLPDAVLVVVGDVDQRLHLALDALEDRPCLGGVRDDRPLAVALLPLGVVVGIDRDVRLDPGPDLEVGRRLARPVVQVVRVLVAGAETDDVAGPQHLLAVVGHQHQLAAEDLLVAGERIPAVAAEEQVRTKGHRFLHLARLLCRRV